MILNGSWCTMMRVNQLLNLQEHALVNSGMSTIIWPFAEKPTWICRKYCSVQKNRKVYTFQEIFEHFRKFWPWWLTSLNCHHFIIHRAVISDVHLTITHPSKMSAKILYTASEAWKPHFFWSKTRFLSEKSTGFRNYAMGYLMEEHRCFPPGHSTMETAELYFQVSCVYAISGLSKGGAYLFLSVSYHHGNSRAVLIIIIIGA